MSGNKSNRMMHSLNPWTASPRNVPLYQNGSSPRGCRVCEPIIPSVVRPVVPKGIRRATHQGRCRIDRILVVLHVPQLEVGGEQNAREEPLQLRRILTQTGPIVGQLIRNIIVMLRYLVSDLASTLTRVIEINRLSQHV